jgi:hypothetical protein
MAYDPSYNGLASGKKSNLRLTKKQVENKVVEISPSVSKVAAPKVTVPKATVHKVTTQNPVSNTPAPRAYA